MSASDNIREERSAQLSFHISGAGKDFSHRPQGIPVEVRRGDMSVAARTTTTDRIDLDPGTYVVMVRLPNGEELLEPITLNAAEEAEVELAASEPEAPPPPAPRDSMPGMKQSVFSADAADEVLEEAPGPAGDFYEESESPERAARVRAVSGNILVHQHSFDALDSSPLYLTSDAEDGKGWKLLNDASGNPPPIFVQIYRSRQPFLNIALPPGAYVRFIPIYEEILEPVVGFEDDTIDEFIQYRSRGLLREAKSMALAMRAEELLYQKIRNTTGAVVGAYALLAFGEIERLHEWTKNLMNWFEELPDGLTIRGEHLARLGNHEGALDCFARLSERGLPSFSDGISYALRRLRYYRSAESDRFPPELLERASMTLQRLEEYVPFLNLNRSTATFTGIDPGRPDRSIPDAPEFADGTWTLLE